MTEFSDKLGVYGTGEIHIKAVKIGLHDECEWRLDVEGMSGDRGCITVQTVTHPCSFLYA